jgi:DUF4097 and DUF4098 domain-containing protein YvlB
MTRTLRLVPSFAALLALGCTFNASWLDRRVEARPEAEAFDVLTVDSTIGGAALDGMSVHVLGGARADATASARVVGILGVNDDADTIMSRFSVDWSRVDASTVAVLVGAAPGADRAWIEEVDIELPAARDLVLHSESGSIEVSGVTGRVEAVATSGSIVVDGAGIVDLEADSGSIEVTAEAGNVHATSGSIELDLAGWVDASADSGSIAGRIGGGGSLTASSGSIDVQLTGPLDRDLVLEAGSGSIRLIVPDAASMMLDLAADGGSVEVDAGGIQHEGDSFLGTVGEGGPTLRARAQSGSIVVVSRSRS